MSTAISLLNIDEQKIEELNKKKLSITQEQTQQAFAYEWSQQEAYESEEHAEVRRKWMRRWVWIWLCCINFLGGASEKQLLPWC